MTDHLVDVSAVIPAYNSAGTLARAVGSIGQQTRRPAEVVIVDDASQDKTSAVAEDLARQYPAGWIRLHRHERNCGPGSARNTGWENAKSTFVAFLDSDDAWHPRKVEIQYDWMKMHPDVGLTGHACPELREGIWPQVDCDHVSVRMAEKLQFLFSNQFSTPTAMLRRDLPYRFAANKRYCEDFLLWLQIVLDGVPTAYIDSPLAAIYKPAYGVTGLSSQLWGMEKGELAMYWQLYRERRLALPATVLFSGASLVKYIRRVVHTTARRKAAIVGS